MAGQSDVFWAWVCHLKRSGNASPSDPDTGRFRRLEEIFLRASELAGNECREYLEAACAGDSELLLEVENMLRLEANAEGHLQEAVGANLEKLVADQVPERIGTYRILELLGRGGLGAVYLGERDDEHFKKRVAIKWLRPEMSGVELERRFLLERQVLAALEHPNIARILDGGTHQGSAYLVMEWVQGRSLIDHCRQETLNLREKLQLFRQVCNAVHYAHQNLILHCDLKPSNILVDGSGSAKLVDFGIAKALRGSVPKDLAGLAATRTQSGIRPLTPEYASPEQAQYLPLTTASDIYSLGVVLYELMSGTRPYEIDTANPLEIAEIIANAPVQRPSLRYRSESSGARRSAPWGTDLDAIVAKAMRKEPELRYGSVEQLSLDLLSYLEDRPVAARRGSWVYPWGKLVRRHRWATAAAVGVLLALSAATVITTRQAAEADEQRRLAEANLAVAQQQTDRAEAVVEILVNLFEISDPAFSPGSEITAMEILEGGTASTLQLVGQPELRAELAVVLGRIYRSLGLLDQAEVLLVDSLDLRLPQLEEHSPLVIDSMRQLALLRLHQNQLDEAERLLNRAFELEVGARGKSSEVYGDLLYGQALLNLEQGQPRRATELLRELLVLLPSGDTEEGHAEDRSDTLHLLSQAAYDEGDFSRAEEMAMASLMIRRHIWGKEHPKIAQSLNNLAALRQSQGDLQRARLYFDEALAMRRKIYGEGHGVVAQSLHNLGVIRSQEGELQLAEGLLQEAQAIAQSVFGTEHAFMADILYTRAGLEKKLRRPDEAARLHLQALEIRLQQLSPGHVRIARSQMGLGDMYRRTDRSKSEAYYRQALATLRTHQEPPAQELGHVLERLGTLVCKETPDEGVKLLYEALEVREASPVGQHLQTAVGEARLGACLAPLNRSQALVHLERALERLEAQLGAEHQETRRVLGWLEDVKGAKT